MMMATIAILTQDGISTEQILGGFFALVVFGGLGGWLWLRRHPDA